MIKRYEDPQLAHFWGDRYKVDMWEEVELAVIQARVHFGQVTGMVFEIIKNRLKAKRVDLERWLDLEEDLKHDLNAFVKERKENLPEDLRRFFHDEMTSYDTEEPAFVIILRNSCSYILQEVEYLEKELIGRFNLEVQHSKLLKGSSNSTFFLVDR